MADSRGTEAERQLQGKFSFRPLAAALLLIAAIVFFDWWLIWVPDRVELGERAATLTIVPADVDAAEFAPLQVHGAWVLDSDDPRFGGVSGLALGTDRVLAVTDSGAIVRFPLPRTGSGRTSATIRELPAGPNSKRFKRNRDSEALVGTDEGWWVAFENSHQVWLYDPAFSRPLKRIRLNSGEWGQNIGIEGVAAAGSFLLLFHETGDRLFEIGQAGGRQRPLSGTWGPISDAAIGDGLLLAIERRLTPLGFANALLVIERASGGYHVQRRFALPLKAYDNVEGLATERRPGGLRLWLITDDNFQAPLRTLLLALDVPAGALGQPAKASANSSR
jgi:hypothetical protein